MIPGRITNGECHLVVKAKIKIPKDTKPIAFHDWRHSNSKNIPGYENLVVYCERKLDDLKAEHILLGDPNRPQLRLVFWFDS